jgi:hypothetical protein
MTKEVVQLVPRMPQRHRPTSQAATRSGITATMTLIEKWIPD